MRKNEIKTGAHREAAARSLQVWGVQWDSAGGVNERMLIYISVYEHMGIYA